MLGFMEDQLKGCCYWCMIKGNNGVKYYPAEDFTMEEALYKYRECGAIVDTITKVEGFGARMSTLGNLYRAEWCFFDSLEDAEKYLDDIYLYLFGYKRDKAHE